jgi:hypothetical protein
MICKFSRLSCNRLVIRIFLVFGIISIFALTGCFQSRKMYYSEQMPQAAPGTMPYSQRRSIVAQKKPCYHSKFKVQSRHPKNMNPNWCDECLQDIQWHEFTHRCGICGYDRCDPCDYRLKKNPNNRSPTSNHYETAENYSKPSSEGRYQPRTRDYYESMRWNYNRGKPNSQRIGPVVPGTFGEEATSNDWYEYMRHSYNQNVPESQQIGPKLW